MQTIYFAPKWFFGYDIGLEFLFAIISLVVAMFAFRVYRMTTQKQTKLFGMAFLLISISYFLQSLFNYLIVAKLSENICRMVKIQDAAVFDAIGMNIQIIFMTAGLALLTYMTLKTEKPRVYWLLLSISLLSIFSSKHVLYMFYLISTILLIFLCWHFFDNYLKKKHRTTLLIAIAFLFLLFRDIQFVFSIDYEIFYVLGRIAELCAYLLIMWNFYLVRKKWAERESD